VFKARKRIKNIDNILIMDIDIFKNKNITGIQSIYSFTLLTKKQNIYLVGENHDFNGLNLNKYEYINDVILNNFQDINLIIEMGNVEVLESAQIVAKNTIPKSPLQDIAYKYIYNQDSIGNNFNIIFANIRRDSPFVILEIIYSFESYLYLNARDKVTDRTSYKDFLRKAKLFERDVFQHLKTRQSAEKFILSLIHPDKTIPKWYIKWCILFEKNAEEHNIKNKLQNMRKYDIENYNYIMQFITSQLSERILDINDYSNILSSVNKERHTNSAHFVINKFTSIHTFFTLLFGLFMDVNILLEIFTAKTDVIVLTGAGHSYILGKFLKDFLDENKLQLNYYSHVNSKGFVDTSKNEEIRHMSVNDVLDDFRNKKNR